MWQASVWQDGSLVVIATDDPGHRHVGQRREEWRLGEDVLGVGGRRGEEDVCSSEVRTIFITLFVKLRTEMTGYCRSWTRSFVHL